MRLRFNNTFRRKAPADSEGPALILRVLDLDLIMMKVDLSLKGMSLVLKACGCRASLYHEQRSAVVQALEKWPEAARCLEPATVWLRSIVGGPGGEFGAQFDMPVVAAGARVDEQCVVIIPHGEVQGITMTVGGEAAEPERRGIQTQEPAMSPQRCQTTFGMIDPWRTEIVLMGLGQRSRAKPAF